MLNNDSFNMDDVFDYLIQKKSLNNKPIKEETSNEENSRRGYDRNHRNKKDK